MISILKNSVSLRAMLLMSAVELGAGFSLSDFANMETDDIKELDSLLMPQGSYAVKVVSVMLGQREAKDGINEKTGLPYAPLFYCERKYEVLEAVLVDKSIDGSRYVGRTIKDTVTFWPESLDDNIGLVKGDYKRVGLDNKGRLGGLEGGEPGWPDGAVDQLIGLRCTHWKDKSGQDRVQWKWFKLDDAESEAEAGQTEAA